jgi:hypothetical protein
MRNPLFDTLEPPFFNVREDRLTGSGNIQPWQADCYRLFSWLDMLQFSATKFVWIGVGLRAIHTDALLTSIVRPGDEPLFNMSTDLDERAISKAIKWLELIEDDLREIGMTISADTAADILKGLKNSNKLRRNCQWLSDQADSLESLVRKELIQRDFFYVPPERSRFFPRKNEPHPFGEAVAVAFPSANFDIHEAAMCMALGRSTAAVMHLMRALEPALGAMAKEANVGLKRDNWHEAIDAVEKTLTPAGLPERDKREFLAGAAVQFRFFKDAWRNHAMHAREKYTGDEAETIYSAARSFMVQLAKRIKE